MPRAGSVTPAEAGMGRRLGQGSRERACLSPGAIRAKRPSSNLAHRSTARRDAQQGAALLRPARDEKGHNER